MQQGNVLKAISDKETQWNYITPYAAWQGGFYERLIRSVKQALYKAHRGAQHRTGDHLRTVLTEFEACLNSRPLTYQSATHEELTSIRPIDFIQKDLVVTLPTEHLLAIHSGDPDYLSPPEASALQTRCEVVEALRTSCQVTENFWKLWHEQYLTNLRETQKRPSIVRRQGQLTPLVGDVVLVSDPVLPRNEWKIGRVSQVKQGRDGAIREVELMTSSKRKIRRPVNLLRPLEVQDSANDRDSDNDFGDNPMDTQNSADPQHGEPTLPGEDMDPSAKTYNYNLQPRPTRPKITDAIATTSSSQRRKIFRRRFLFYLMIVSGLANTATPHTPCSDKGVLVSKAHKNVTFEICTDQSYKHDDQEWKVVATFPPACTLKDYRVMLKWSAGREVATVKTVCRALDFCENIECWFCLQVLCNPECWPIGAISVFLFSLYFVVTACHLRLCVPMTIGKPIRLILHGTYIIPAWILSTFGRCILQLGRCITSGRKRSRWQRLLLTPAVVLYITAVATGGASACQLVDAFEHRLTVCSMDTGQACNITTTELLKLNAFKQEACLRILYNSSLISIIKVRWKGLYLSCEKETLYFTRPTSLKMLDSKPCAHTGNVANINSSTLVHELEEANHYPGRTGCLESCGWLGCGCWCPGSGCLLYRVYAVSTAETIYEVFRCMRWSQQVKLLLTMEDFYHEGGKQQFELMVK
nr:putative integrase core domain protein [Haemonchus contortus]